MTRGGGLRSDVYPKGSRGVSRLLELSPRRMLEQWADLDDAEVAFPMKIGIETDRGPWVAARVAAGYEVFAINPK